MLRSCYTADVIFRPGDAPQKVQWFFCSPEAQDLPFATVFQSGIWNDKSEVSGEVGEVYPQSRQWRNGMRPAAATGHPPGREPWPESWLADGIPSGESTSYPVLASGFPVPCVAGAIGLGWGGAARMQTKRLFDRQGGLAWDRQGGKIVFASQIVPTALAWDSAADITPGP